jgi:L-serine dehydratase
MSVFDLFKIGIGPSSSHTVGPMVAARRFLLETGAVDRAAAIQVDLYGSLALTGVGHGTDTAIILGLMGETPQDVDPAAVQDKLAEVRLDGTISLLGRHSVPFPPSALGFHMQESLPEHPNGMRFTLLLEDGGSIAKVFYSVGGGFVRAEGEAEGGQTAPAAIPYPFDTMEELLAQGERSGCTIPQMLRANECARMPDARLEEGLDRIWQVMRDCIAAGLVHEGQLPGGLQVKRRAARLWRQVREAANHADGLSHANELPDDTLHHVTLYAMAVNEENAAGGRVVTAPTNGAAGIIPAVLRYYVEDCRPSDAAGGVREFLLTAAAIGMLCKKNASISGAEVGCQGEVGVACAMAAAGLVAALGGSNRQIENAAEIGIEHHLGMTCDPIGGLVQIPCIERNGMGAVKAITAASLALKGDGTHFVSLDNVIATMRQTGADMQAKYKETSLGGLAVHVVTVNHPAC